MNNVVWGGMHRGFLAIAKELDAKTTRLYDRRWLLADPQENRAEQMAALLRNQFATLDPQPLRMQVQDALALSRDGYPFNAGQLGYDWGYSKTPGMLATEGYGFRGLKSLRYIGVPP